MKFESEPFEPKIAHFEGQEEMGVPDHILSADKISDSLRGPDENLIKVNIRRGSGEMDSDWTIVGIYYGDRGMAEDIKVKVFKEGVGAKEVSLNDLREWNQKGESDSVLSSEPSSAEPTIPENTVEARKTMAELLTPEGIHESIAAPDNSKLIDVVVRRSSGEMDTDWKVIGISKLGRSNQGEVIIEVTKSGVGSKKVPLSKLREWNLPRDEEYDEDRAARAPGSPRPTREEIEREFGE